MGQLITTLEGIRQALLGIQSLPLQGPTGPAGVVNHGVSFPAEPAEGEWFLHDVYGIPAQYISGSWLAPPEPVPFSPWQGSNPYTSAGNAAVAGTPGNFVYDSAKLVLLPSSPNDGSNYWTVTLKVDTTTDGTLTTSAMTANVTDIFSVSVPLVVRSPTRYLLISIAKTGAPGSLYLVPRLMVRRVVG